MDAKKHWTSMFIKSNSSTSSSNQLPETSDSSAMRLPYSEVDETSHNYGLERETSQPKARTRWNPKPEQIRILEAIFQSGVVSPPREEIKRIRAQLEVFGEVGDANVFYWFQNRKSRSKRKPRLPAAQRSKSRTLSSTSSTSTSTSVHSKSATEISNSPPNFIQKNVGDQYISPSPVPVSSFAGNHYDIQGLYQEMSKTSTSAPSSSTPIGDQYYCSSVAPVYSSAEHHYNLHASTSVPYETLPNPSNCPPSAMAANIGDQYCLSSAAPVDSSTGHHNDLRTMYDEMSYNMQAIGGAAAGGGQSILNEGIGGVQDGSIINPNPSITVFINDVPTAVPSGPINLRDFFENDAFLLHSSGEFVLVNDFGFASLEPGATYFMI